MNSLQIELDKINQQLEHLTFRKNQLEPIIAEYSDVIERVKNLTENMIALNIEPTNLKYDIEDILEGNEAGEWVSEADPFKTEENLEPPKPMNWADQWVETTEAHSEQPEDYDVFYPANDWEKVAPHAYYHSELRSVKLIVPWVNIETLGEVDEICNEICHQAELANSYEIEEWGDNWAIYLSVEGYSPDDVDSMIAAFFPEPELTPEPTPQPVRLMAFVPFIPGLPPELTQEPTPEPDPEECPKCEGEGVIELPIEVDQTCPTCGGTGEKPEPQPEPVQINMQAYRRQDNILLIGFTNKRLLNTWEKWFIKSTPHVKTSNSSDHLQGFNYCLTLTWDTDRNAKNWEYLAKLNYSLKPTEQKHQSSVTVGNSEEE